MINEKNNLIKQKYSNLSSEFITSPQPNGIHYSSIYIIQQSKNVNYYDI